MIWQKWMCICISVFLCANQTKYKEKFRSNIVLTSQILYGKIIMYIYVQNKVLGKGMEYEQSYKNIQKSNILCVVCIYAA